MKITAAITAVGHFLPEYILTNAELETIVDTKDEWIRDRTGISERRILKGNKGVSFMAEKAVLELCERRGISPMEIDLLIVATVTPDYTFPATANIVADRIGAKKAWGFDIEAACSGFLYALVSASKFIETGAHKKVVVVGADKMSSIIDYQDRNTCIIFGDGAGAVLLEPNTEGLGIQDSVLHSDGSGCQYLHMKAGGSLNETSVRSALRQEHYVHQEGKTVFKFAVTQMADVGVEIMEKNNLKAEDIAWLVPHQANKRIIDATSNRMGLPDEKVMVNIHKYGNTTSGTLPICLYEWEKKMKKGDNIILAAFGGGFTWGAVYIKWAY